MLLHKDTCCIRSSRRDLIRSQVLVKSAKLAVIGYVLFRFQMIFKANDHFVGYQYHRLTMYFFQTIRSLVHKVAIETVTWRGGEICRSWRLT